MVDPKCLLCRRVRKDGGRLFIKCKAAKEGWRPLQLEEIRMELQSWCSVSPEFTEAEARAAFNRPSSGGCGWMDMNKTREGDMPDPVEILCRRVSHAVLLNICNCSRPTKLKLTRSLRNGFERGWCLL